MSKIFISYRRDDSQYVTDSVHSEMCRHFGAENVFLDVESIPFGVNFRKYLAEQVANNDAVLVTIGPDWARIMQERADQDNDFLRIEIESALEQGKLVIPMLVKGASMPDFAVLPDSISELQWLNSAKIRRKPDLESDCERLAQGIKQSLGVSMFSSTIKTDQWAIQLSAVLDTLPQPFEWIRIPAGQVTLAEDSHKGSYLSRNTSRDFYVPEFFIAKYPLTRAQYSTYTDEGYASGQGNHPVAGIDWLKSMEFCNWLGEKTGLSITLPTEQQWQRAAQGDDGRRYPWGNKFDASRCNTKESDINDTTPVNQYPMGASPYGVMDMSGNAWEWCLTSWKTGINDLRGLSGQVVRGGSWCYGHIPALCTYRNAANPFLRKFDHGSLGFRLCV